MWHPDCKKGEEWVGNTTATSYDTLPEHLKPLKSIRLDGTAYDINGVPLSAREHRPLIMSAADATQYNRIMEQRLTLVRKGLLK